MSAGVAEMERGDDRNPEIMVQRLHEMFNQPDAKEPTYISDTPGVSAGEYAPINLGHERRAHQPARLGSIAVRRVHIRPSTVPPDNYKG